MSRLSFGNANMPKICLQSLVRLIVTMENDIAVRIHLEELLDYEIVPLIATYIRSGKGFLRVIEVQSSNHCSNGIDLNRLCCTTEDFELVYWALGLMHEFAIKGVALDEFKETRGLCRSINVLLAADESYVSRIVLRTLKFLILGDGKRTGYRNDSLPVLHPIFS